MDHDEQFELQDKLKKKKKRFPYVNLCCLESILYVIQVHIEKRIEVSFQNVKLFFE